METGEKIRALRIARKITQEQLSSLTGISVSSIKKYENGIRNPKSGQLLKISEALGIDIAELIEFAAKGEDPATSSQPSAVCTSPVPSELHNDLLEIFSDCTPDESELLIENARLLKNYIRKIQKK